MRFLWGADEGRNKPESGIWGSKRSPYLENEALMEKSEGKSLELLFDEDSKYPLHLLWKGFWWKLQATKKSIPTPYPFYTWGLSICLITGKSACTNS